MDRVGSKKTDTVCGGKPLMEGMGERIYSVGNEREVSRTNNKAKYGVSRFCDCDERRSTNFEEVLLNKADVLIAIPELMNESKKPITVYITMVGKRSPVLSQSRSV
jgi:hypothetical protein